MINAKRLPRANTSAFATIVAIVLALMATMAVYLYLKGVREESTTGPTRTSVIVAKDDIPAGSDLSTLVAEGAFTTISVPNNLVVPGAITELSQLEVKATADAILAGEQIPIARLEGTVPGGTLGIPKGYEAVSFPIDAAKVAGGDVRKGDRIAIYGTFEDVPVEQGGPDATVVLVPDAQILKVSGGADTSAGAISSGSGELVLTLALKGKDAQKVIFAQEKGTTWMALLAPNGTPPAEGLIGIRRVIP